MLIVFCFLRTNTEITSTKENSMPAFTRYFDDNIKAWIETQEEQDIVTQVNAMNGGQLDEFHDDLLLTKQLACGNPSYKTHNFMVKHNAFLRADREWKRANANPKVTVLGCLGAALAGIIGAQILYPYWNDPDKPW